MKNNEIGRYIYNKRKSLGMTLEEFGNKIGVGKSTVNRWETGYISSMKCSNLVKIVTLFGISADEMLGINTKKKSITVKVHKVNAYQGGKKVERNQNLRKLRVWLGKDSRGKW